MDTPNTNAVVSAATKPGWQTSEFWSMVATSLVAILNKAFGWHIPDETVITVAGMVASYALSRGVTKHASATATAP